MADDKRAVENADILLRQLVEHQPGLFAMKMNLQDSTGTDAAEFIRNLRAGLISMYTATPRV